MANYTSQHTGTQVDTAITKVKDSSVTQADLVKLASVTATAVEMNQLDDKTIGGTNSDDIVDIGSTQELINKTLDGGTFI